MVLRKGKYSYSNSDTRRVNIVKNMLLNEERMGLLLRQSQYDSGHL